MQTEAGVSTGLVLVCLVVYLVGFASPFWLQWQGAVAGTSASLGLWQYCGTSLGHRQCFRIGGGFRMAGQHLHTHTPTLCNEALCL